MSARSSDLDFSLVGAAINVVSTATISLISANILKLDFPRKIPLSVEIRKIRCLKTGRLSYNFTVLADNYKVKETVLHLAAKTEIAITQAVGYVYRHVICLFLQRRTPPVLSATSATYINRTWSPFQITVFALQLATQTHPVTFKSVQVVPEGIEKSTIRVAHPNGRENWNVHVLYMQSQIQLVKRKLHLQRTTHVVPYTAGVQFFTANNGYRWSGDTSHPIQEAARNLWILLASIL